jgi:protein phosphatase
MNRIAASKVKSTGEQPSARFGHTLTMVSKTKAVLFGGAISENGTIQHHSGKFVITNETYLYDFITSRWKKLQFDNCQVPSERAAHASAAVGELQLAVYGGAASGTNGLLKDDLHILDLKKEYSLLDTDQPGVPLISPIASAHQEPAMDTLWYTPNHF